MSVYHILNGDCLAEQLAHSEHSGVRGNFIVCRESLVDGNVSAESWEEFWKARAEYISSTFQVSDDEYFSKTVKEFERIKNIPAGSEVCLWFENDLFCQVNMWFVISFLKKRDDLNIFRIYPVIDRTEDTWKGFGISDAKDLEQAYELKSGFAKNDLVLGTALWEAFKKKDFEKLLHLSKTISGCFQFLEEVCRAHVERFPAGKAISRPKKIMKEIIKNHPKNFQQAFQEFSKMEGIYGFSDLQVKSIYDELMRDEIV